MQWVLWFWGLAWGLIVWAAVVAEHVTRILALVWACRSLWRRGGNEA